MVRTRCLAGLVVLLSVIGGARASASTIMEPAHAPVVVSVATSGPPAAVTVVASGFSSGALVYVEQCDGVAPTTPQWSPTADCDLGSSPAPVIADGRGIATFAASDKNHAFRPFVGESPQSIFNCLAPGRPAPANGLASSTKCSLRVSTNNAAATGDQAFLAVAFTTAKAAPSASDSTTTTTAGRASTRSKPSATAKGAAASAARAKAAARKAKTSAPSDAVAVLSAPHTAQHVGAFSLSDANLATGYVLVLGGLLMVALTIALLRRDAGRTRAR
ncbi:MAG TPA: hypothetical protein VGP92_07490 [Acidimicrobiia bacterium]|nr:hypothetical protein [Acidimicrobiia bacterium]